MSRPTILITGASKRLGKAIALAFAQRGCNLILHYNHSNIEAKTLATKINQITPNSCITIQADLTQKLSLSRLIHCGLNNFGRLDHLINNASVFYPAPIALCEPDELSTILQTNLFAPATLAQHAMPQLKKNTGSIVNLIDIYADTGLAEHSFYVAAKSALKAITKLQAERFSPQVRSNGISPGAILWPDEEKEANGLHTTQIMTTVSDSAKKQAIIKNSALKRLGQAENIAATAIYLALDAQYTTGSIINVDGGRRDYI